MRVWDFIKYSLREDIKFERSEDLNPAISDVHIGGNQTVKNLHAAKVLAKRWFPLKENIP
jgi:hypothetical protein